MRQRLCLVGKSLQKAFWPPCNSSPFLPFLSLCFGIWTSKLENQRLMAEKKKRGEEKEEDKSSHRACVPIWLILQTFFSRKEEEEKEPGGAPVLPDGFLQEPRFDKLLCYQVFNKSEISHAQLLGGATVWDLPRTRVLWQPCLERKASHSTVLDIIWCHPPPHPLLVSTLALFAALTSTLSDPTRHFHTST